MLRPKGGTMGVQNSKIVDIRNKAFSYQTKKAGSALSKKKKNEKYNPSLATIIIAGSARLPEGVTAKQVFGCLTIELEVDPVNSEIVDFSCTLLPHLGEKILRDTLLGSNVEEGIEGAIAQLNRRFFNPTKRAIIAALEDAYKWYKKYLKTVI